MEGPTFSVQIRHGDEGDNTPNNGGGLEVDLGTILGSRYRATKYHLIRYIEKKCDTENVFVTPLLKIWNFSSKGMILINTPGVEIIRREAQGEQNSLLASHDDSPTSIEIINGTGSSSRPEHRTMMRHAACRDLVQMNLVLLQDILRKVEAKVKPEAIRAQITFWIIAFLRYTYGKLLIERWRHTVVGYILLVLTTLAAGYAVYTTSAWGIIWRCSRKAARVKELFNSGQLGIRHKNIMDGWRWSAAEWIAEFYPGASPPNTRQT